MCAVLWETKQNSPEHCKFIISFHDLQIGGNLHCIMVFQRSEFQGPFKTSKASASGKVNQKGQGDATQPKSNMDDDTSSVITLDVQSDSDESIDPDDT